MNNDNLKTKQCRQCREFINKKASICPYCRSNQISFIWIIVMACIIAFPFIYILEKDTDNSYNDSYSKNNYQENSQQNNIQENIVYKKVSKDVLDDVLENNAAVAKESYKDRYIEVTGKLGTIDADLKYISLVSSTKEWDFNGILCNIKNNSQKNIVISLSKGQEVTIKGKVTSVGEVMGYSLDIVEIIY